MLSRRNLVMMLTMFGVVLVLFLSTAVLREYFNDYDVNHAAQEERILPAAGASTADGQQVVYVGAQDTDLYQPVVEWAEYRKMALHEAMDVQTGLGGGDGQYETADEQHYYRIGKTCHNLLIAQQLSRDRGVAHPLEAGI